MSALPQQPLPRRYRAGDSVEMREPGHPSRGQVLDGDPLVVGGVRYWNVAWMFAGERRVTWSPEAQIRLAARCQRQSPPPAADNNDEPDFSSAIGAGA